MTDYSTNTGATDISGSWSQRSLTAFFDDPEDARDAVRRLREAGIPDACVTLTQGSGSSDAAMQDTGLSGTGHSGSGSVSGTGESTRSGGFFESLADFLFPEDDRHAYAEGLSRGGHLVTVTDLSEDQYDLALDILDDEGAVDMEERTESWRSEGWTGGSRLGGMATGGAMIGSGAGSMGQGAMTGATAGEAEGSSSGSLHQGQSGLAGVGETIEVMEERLRVGKREEMRGRVRVRSYVVEEPVSEDVTLREERVEIERRPVDRPAGSVTDTAFTDRTIEAEAYREEAVVSKEARVVEEIGLRKTADERTETVTDTVRHTEVEIEDDRNDSMAGSGGSSHGGAGTDGTETSGTRSGLGGTRTGGAGSTGPGG